MTSKRRADMLNEMCEITEKYGFQVCSYDDMDDTCGVFKIMLIRVKDDDAGGKEKQDGTN